MKHFKFKKGKWCHVAIVQIDGKQTFWLDGKMAPKDMTFDMWVKFKKRKKK